MQDNYFSVPEKDLQNFRMFPVLIKKRMYTAFLFRKIRVGIRKKKPGFQEKRFVTNLSQTFFADLSLTSL